MLAALWAAYGLLPRTSALRLPLHAALVTAQLPLTLWALAADAGLYGITAAVLVTAGFDTGVALRVPAKSVRITAVIGAYGMGAWGVWAAGWLSWTAAGPSAAARAAALLLFAAGIALTAAWQQVAEKQAAGLAVTAGLLTVAAVGGRLAPCCRTRGRFRRIWPAESLCWRRYGWAGCRRRYGTG